MGRFYVSVCLILTFLFSLFPSIVLADSDTMEIRDAGYKNSILFGNSDVKSGVCGDGLTWILDDDGTVTISGFGDMTSYNSGFSPWYYRSDILGVQIEYGTHNIGSTSFQGCSNLASISIADSVRSIGIASFSGCNTLTNVKIPDGVTSIAFDAFSNCTSLTEMTLPVTLSSVGTGAFAHCDALTDIYYNGTQSDWNAISIGDDNQSLVNATLHFNVFAHGYCGGGADGKNLCWILTNNGDLIISGNGVMGSYPNYSEPWFEYDSYIQSLTVEDGVTSVDEGAFAGYSNLTRAKISGSVQEPCITTFYGCSNLSQVELANGISTIGDGMFLGCTSLINITIPESVSSIGNSAFSDCTNLKEVNIQGNISSIDAWAFGGCSSLTDITIPNTVLSIGPWAFGRCTSLRTVQLSDKMTNIEIAAFNGCENLLEINIPSSVKYVENKAFENCSSLSDVYYHGTKEQWNKVSIEADNDPLHSANIHFLNSEGSVFIESVNRDGDIIEVSVSCEDTHSVVFCAIYNNNGKMFAVHSTQVTNQTIYEFQFDGQQFDYAKVFILDSALRPLCESKRT